MLKLWKWCEVFLSSFHKSNLKSWWTKKYELKGPNMHNPNQFMASQNLLYNFFRWNSNVINFLQDLVYLRLISKSLQHYRKWRLQWVPLHKILNKKVTIIHFQNWIFDAKTRLKKQFSKNIYS